MCGVQGGAPLWAAGTSMLQARMRFANCEDPLRPLGPGPLVLADGPTSVISSKTSRTAAMLPLLVLRWACGCVRCASLDAHAGRTQGRPWMPPVVLNCLKNTEAGWVMLTGKLCWPQQQPLGTGARVCSGVERRQLSRDRRSAPSRPSRAHAPCVRIAG
jgi:hypothetical protein